jgi:hypothetical protein
MATSGVTRAFCAASRSPTVRQIRRTNGRTESSAAARSSRVPTPPETSKAPIRRRTWIARSRSTRLLLWSSIVIASTQTQPERTLLPLRSGKLGQRRARSRFSRTSPSAAASRPPLAASTPCAAPFDFSAGRPPFARPYDSRRTCLSRLTDAHRPIAGRRASPISRVTASWFRPRCSPWRGSPCR